MKSSVSFISVNLRGLVIDEGEWSVESGKVGLVGTVLKKHLFPPSSAVTWGPEERKVDQW